MRVTFNSTYSQAAHDLSRIGDELTRAQREVSSGRRLNTASDDPSAAAGSVRERGELALIGQYRQAADNANSRLAVIDSVLSDSILQLQSAQTALLSARGSTATPATREAAANELTAIRDALLSNMNTTFRGTHLFGGRSGTLAPYEKQPDGTVTAAAIDDTPIEAAVGNELSVRISYSGHAIAQGSAAHDVFETLARAIEAVRTGEAADMATAAAELTEAFERFTSAQSHVGSSLNAIEGQQARLSQLRLAGETRVARYENADPAEAISRMNQADTAYRAALGAISNIGRVSLMDYLR